MGARMKHKPNGTRPVGYEVPGGRDAGHPHRFLAPVVVDLNNRNLYLAPGVLDITKLRCLRAGLTVTAFDRRNVRYVIS